MSAPVFMVAMGVGFACTRQQSPGHFISRGLNMLCLGYLLNVLRHLSVVIYDVSSGKLMIEDLIMELIQNDIFHFVGFAMILFGLLRKLKLSDVHILIISIVMSLINTAIPMIISGSLALNAAAGHFIFIGHPEDTIMCFPLFSWFVFPAFGYWLMNRLKAPGRTESVFKIALIPCLVIFAGAAVFEKMLDVNMMSGETDCFYYRMVSIDAVISICYTMFCFAFFFFMSRILSEKLLKFISAVSNALNMIYMIHWLLLPLIAKVIISKIMGFPYEHLLSITVSIFITVVSGYLGIRAKDYVKARLAVRPDSILRFVK